VGRSEKVSYSALSFSRDVDFLYAVRSEVDKLGLYYLYKIPILGGTEKRLVADIDTKVTLRRMKRKCPS
jgi:hypothetical protein